MTRRRVSRPADSAPRPEEGSAMTSEAPDLRDLAQRLEAIRDRVTKVEVQVRTLVMS